MTSRRLQALFVFLGYAAVSFAMFGIPIIARPGTYVGAGGPDAKLFMWCLTWWPYAFGHLTNPLVTHAVWAPTGFNLTWATSVPGPSLVTAPTTLLFGPVVSYNLLAVLAPAASGWAAFLLCRRLTDSFWASVVGGYIFGFSTYTFAELQGHLNLFLVFAVPLAAYLVVRHAQGGMGWLAFVLLEAGVLLAEFSVSTEIFFTSALFGGLTLLVCLIVLPGARRVALLRTTALLVGAYALALLIASPYVYSAFAHGIPTSYVHSSTRASADLLAFVVPSQNTLIANNANGVSARFVTNLVENGAYLGVVLLGAVVAFAFAKGRSLGAKLALLIPFVVVAVASLGRTLVVGGNEYGRMPWSLVAGLPLFDKVVPVRFTMYLFLLAAVIVAMWVASSPRSVPRWTVAVAGALLLLPNLPAGLWRAPVKVPAFFSTGAYRSYLDPGVTALVIPYRSGEAMLWQAETGMHYRMAGGYLGTTPPEFRGRPVVQHLMNSNVTPRDVPDLRRFLRSHGVGAIVVVGGEQRELWRSIAPRLGATLVHPGAVDVYSIRARGAA